MLTPSDEEVRALTSSTAAALWPAEAYAAHAQDDYVEQSKGDDWSEFAATSLSLERLIATSPPTLAENGTMVAVFMVPQRGDNPLLPAEVLLRDLRDELKNYS